MNRIEYKWVTVPIDPNVDRTIIRFGNNDSDAEIQRKIDEIDAKQKAEDFANLQRKHAIQ